MKRNLLLGLLIGTFLSASAQQQERFTITPNAGIVLPMLDEGAGILLGVNPVIRLASWISAEGEVSLIAVRITSKFLSGPEPPGGGITALQAMGGLRIYLNKEKRRVRPFINAMLGVARVSETGISSETTGGLSMGAFLQGRHLMGGIALETPGFLVFKMGYTLPVRMKAKAARSTMDIQ